MSIALSKFKEPLTKGMSVMSLIAFLWFSFIGKILVDVFEVNQTMGWRLSISQTWIDRIPVYSFLIYFVVYMFLNLLKIRTDLTISAIHFSLIGLIAFLYNFWELDLRIHLFVIGLSWIIFGLNVYRALMLKNQTNN